MIKGISKQIIEIKCPNNEYFEKALLFVNTKNQTFSQKVLNTQAKAFSKQLAGQPTDGKRKSEDQAAMKILCIAVFSVIALMLITLLILI